ncbi:MAG: DUF459 domain-containing protein [Acidimicrobiia bacterium]
MAEPQSSLPSRRSTRAARQRRWKQIAGASVSVVMLAAIVVVVLVVTGVVELGSSGSAKTTGAARATTTTTRAPHRSRTHHRALTASAPLRLWIAGDSLAGSVGPSLGQITAQTGVVQPQYDSRVSSGLSNPGFFDWPKHAKEQLALLDPEAVVFVIGTNDANVWDDSQAAGYRLRTLSMMRMLVGSEHRTVYWVGPPVARDKSLEEGVKAVDLIARQAAKEVPGVTYVDAHALFDDDLGRYQQSFDNELGVRQVMRAGDGIHFSVDGGDYIGRAIFRMLDRDWSITKQADPTHPKQVRETQGSTQVPGTHRSIGAQVVGGSGTTTTTQPRTQETTSSTTSSTSTTTAPPTTTTTTTTTSPPGP